ncbi:type II CRISPR RNA-guided endonuclease Cas9 [Latilactobacillus graminis]|uniref:CRISPR-associated endonuclease Cas9 n=2 Tax=Latilactobacillus graminis TaxID=60519 RepID=A0AA89I786_9LACO|nr:type II CRISPR RNA-guided endonuclease Cas9 [Latilactobacillus graminis]KRM22352.1 HNH endonuclease family protein [Latilactobacillus graminis DSM 20719]QFP79474.1 type II CRISPR RNA-guided endonuclease Cas9 [Latilactobacillus graminis]
MKRSYNIGLDIGTNSIGWAIVDDQSKLISVKGKYGYGVRLYDEGQTAAERRSFRTTRRRLKRRKWRLGLLREIFEPYITPIDSTFFLRQKQSNLSPKDQRKLYPQTSLFNDRPDADFYQQYPTIYHLRYQLMTEKRQFDIREIYLAMHHIVKYRGHFLNEAPVASFKSSEINLAEHFDQLNTIFADLFRESGFQLETDELVAVKALLMDNQQSASNRQRKALPKLYTPSADKSIEKQRKAIATEILKAILGLKAKFNVVTGIEAEDVKAWALTFNAENFDEELAKLESSLDDNGHEVIGILQELYSGILLAGIVPENQSLSQAMITKYEEHQAHLKMLKAVRDDLATADQQKLKKAYDQYIDGQENTKAYSKEAFYDDVTKALKDYSEQPLVSEIQKLIELDQFMPKQRTKDNGAIPHQLHQQELDRIIENQQQYYPWLAELNPNPKRQTVAKYKLDELVAFRVPYYVGPLITAEQQQQSSNAKFAWMIRKTEGRITPWNFDDKVDRQASANEFIKRMTTTDTYLLAEDVLPKQSLIYQRFEVLNELNGLKIDDQPITNELKQAIFNDLFMQKTSVSVKNIQDYLVSEKRYASRPAITGLSDEKKFNSRLSTYHDLKVIVGDAVDDVDKQADLEKCIEWSTIFEDGKIYSAKLNEITWLTEQQRGQLATKRYRGWGRLSAKLLTQIVNANGQRIMDLLWDTTDNFMRIVHFEDFDKLITEANQMVLAENDVQDVINDLYTSPQNKKALRQILLVVNDIQKAMKGQAPERILIEFARGAQKDKSLTVRRKRKLDEMYSQISDAVLADESVRQELKSSNQDDLVKEKVYLYFMQGGRDLYTGNALNIDRLSDYHVDHIIPQAYIKDDSLDNKALVSSRMNEIKADRVPLQVVQKQFGKNMASEWGYMHRAGLISRKKYDNLMFNPENLNKYQINRFISRQLVETQQVIKLVANLLSNQYEGDNVKIITVKSKLTQTIRSEFDFPKNREVNNYHHAFDAYLTAFVGMYLLKRYPKLSSYFTYGEYLKGNQQDKWSSFNFLNDLKRAKLEDKTNKEIFWHKESGLAYLNKIYQFKKILVTREVHENSGALFNQTLYAAKDDKASGQGGKQLIPAKQARPTALYGGYSGKTVAYMCIVRIKNKKGDLYKVCGVETSWLAQLKQLKDEDSQKAFLKQKISPQFTKAKKQKGTIVKVVEDFEVIAPHILINQRLFDNGQELTLGSATYKHNEQELILDKTAVKLLNGELPLAQSEELAELVYDEILDQVMHYFPLYDTNQFRAKLLAGKTAFMQLPWKSNPDDNKTVQITQPIVLKKILQGLHADAGRVSLKELGMTTDFGMLQKATGITFTPDTQIIYQSPTGLFERRVALRDL